MYSIVCTIVHIADVRIAFMFIYVSAYVCTTTTRMYGFGVCMGNVCVCMRVYVQYKSLTQRTQLYEIFTELVISL